MMDSINDFVDVDDYEQFKKTTMKDLPNQEKRDFMKTSNVKVGFTEIANKNASSKITEFEVKKFGIGGFKKLISFKIETVVQGNTYNWNVQRTDEDFFTLRKLMNRAFPYMIIPPLPGALKDLKSNDQKLPKRQRHY